MLKRLELVGFKSFADKTQFDFSPGITAIVGPNGSGKSNIVDAVRWILGEQSAKSLRGGEMADVIFNGSTTRRSQGLAEVTMTFDNTRRQLATAAPEVQIARRVYRSGEGEYLINHQLCRLKDIKELFLGSGAGSQTYCIIEQGRVDVLLQASTKERRIIFEEAAGISRFKAKKLETLRRLERVDQNLQRLNDIIGEVDSKLRSVKLQASNAQRYQEHSKRLQELRMALGLDDYHQLTLKLRAEQAVLDALRGDLARHAERADGWEAELRGFDEALTGLDEGIHAQEAVGAQAGQQIAAAETTLGRERSLAGELEEELTQRRLNLVELTARVAALEADAGEAAGDCAAVEGQCREQRRLVQGMNDALQSSYVRAENLRRAIKTDQAEHLEHARRAALLENEASGRRSQLDNLQRELDRKRLSGNKAAENLASLDRELALLTQTEEQFQQTVLAARQAYDERTRARERIRQLGKTTAARAVEQREQRSGLASRIEVLDGLERSHEGLGAGVREVFALLEQPEPGPWRTVLGMVADLLTVAREHAPLIDLALAEHAQRFLVRDPAALDEALLQRPPFSSRVSFLPFQAQEGPPPVVMPPADAALPAAGVVTPALPEAADLPARLLGNTCIVDDLAFARALARRFPNCRFITRQGELLEADGSLTVGRPHAAAAILSRKSELRELRAQAAALDEQIAATEHDLAGLRQQETTLDNGIVALQQEIDGLNNRLADLRQQIGQQRQRRADLHDDVQFSQQEIGALEQDSARAASSFQEAQLQHAQAEQQVSAIETRLEQLGKELAERELQWQQQQQERTTAGERLAQVEERLKGLKARHQQLDTNLSQRRRDRQQGEQQLLEALGRCETSQRTMLEAQASLADWYLVKESAQRTVADLAARREEHRQRRQALADQLHQAQQSWHGLQEQVHQRDLAASDLRHRRDSIVERLREDYQVDLAALYRSRVASPGSSAESQSPESLVPGPDGPAPSGETAEPAATVEIGPAAGDPVLDTAQVQQEIDELRRKLSRLGNVNLEAIAELIELEKRAGELKVQHDDLTAAQKSLLEIINQINHDSRRLFTETLAAIRGHFQELFRKLFGGGLADVVLEDENDILECGIEIIARPPGKELRSISLMSGGEKTLTAVALLLAIFRSKPSPFCILDEVDAALDEANIGRFTAVLREFLDLSQFILITHSKKTMATADVLYGITMQESGISKRMAVRFEDWPGEKSAEPQQVRATG